MNDWLDTYERHIPEHLEQMQANLEDWMKQNNQKAKERYVQHGRKDSVWAKFPNS